MEEEPGVDRDSIFAFNHVGFEGDVVFGWTSVSTGVRGWSTRYSAYGWEVKEGFLLGVEKDSKDCYQART